MAGVQSTTAYAYIYPWQDTNINPNPIKGGNKLLEKYLYNGKKYNINIGKKGGKYIKQKGGNYNDELYNSIDVIAIQDPKINNLWWYTISWISKDGVFNTINKSSEELDCKTLE